jgi:iron complex transport system substrate-binding protein
MLVVLLAGAALAVGPAAGQSSTDTQSLADSHGNLDCGFPLTVEDATGETVSIEEEPTEVVALYPNVAQHLWEIGAQEKVVGMPVYEDTAYLEGSEQRTHVLGPNNFQPDNEQIVDLDPDIVLAPSITPDDAITELRNAGVTVYIHERTGSFDDVMAMTERVGQLVGACDEARNVSAEMADRIEFVEEAVADEQRPRVFYDLGDEPVGPVTVNSNAFEHEVLRTAGAENIAADVEKANGYPQVSTEFILDEEFDIVVTPESLSSFPGYNETRDRVITIDADFISQHAPRTVNVLEDLANELHPEAMAQARQNATDDSETGNETESDTDSGSDTENGTITDEETIIDNGTDNASDNESADDNGAGLTVLAPALALVALALLARRRQS